MNHKRMVPRYGVAVVLCWLGATSLSSLAAQGQTKTFLFDDFEDYDNDEQVTDDGGWSIHEVNDPVEVSAEWTVENRGNRNNPPSEDGSPTTGRFMISDSDTGSQEADGQGTGRSHDLWTPAFDTSGSNSVWLHFDCSAQLNNNGTCIFSVVDGEEWDNVFLRVAPSRGVDPLPDRENTDGFFGRLHIDLSDFASNESSVIVRFRHFEPDWDWWVAIDNVLIDNDGSINLTDPVNLLGHLFNSQPPPAPPGPESCGPDPDESGSPGDLGCEQYTSC